MTDFLQTEIAIIGGGFGGASGKDHAGLGALDRKGWPVSALERKWPVFEEADHSPLDPGQLW